MSSALPRRDARTTALGPVQSAFHAVMGGLVALARAIAFWATIALPLAYLPVLAGAVGIGVDLLVGLLAAHTLCVLIGHRHTPSL